MKKPYLSAICAALALAAFSSPAYAASAITCDSATNATSCSFFHSFGNSPGSQGEVSPGMGTDFFQFSVVGLKTLTGSLGNFYTTISENVNFPAGGGAPTISGGSLASPVRWVTTAAGNPDIRSVGPLLLGAGTYTVRVNYSAGANGFYDGTLSLISAIPEPASWALMIMGFGLVGGALRMRKSGKVTALAR